MRLEDATIIIIDIGKSSSIKEKVCVCPVEKPYDARNFYFGKGDSDWLIYSCRIGFGSLVCCSDFFERLVPPRKKEENSYSFSKKEGKEPESEPIPANPIKSEDIIFQVNIIKDFQTNYLVIVAKTRDLVVFFAKK